MNDDQGYGELSCHGHAHLKTPDLDRLADAGVEITDFHLDAGQTEIETWFGTSNDKTLGAYYLDVRRL